MKTTLHPTTTDVLTDVQYHPVISLLIPFEPKMVLKTRLLAALGSVTARVEQQLLEKYQGDIAMLMIAKLHSLMAGLNYNTHKKSIAIYLSPVIEKVLYLDIVVQEKIAIDGAFNIRELVEHKKKEQAFLVMLLTNKESRIYLGNGTGLVRIVTTTPKPLLPQDKKQPAGDLAELRKMMQEQFMAHAGNTLGIILKAYPLPLFIIGNEELLSQFKAFSNGGHTVVKYIFADFADATVKEIQKNISATIGDWSMVHHQYLACRLEKAAREKRLVTGIKDVWKNAIHHKGSLLLVDKNYHCSDPQPTGEDILSNLMEPYHPFSYIKNTVDDIIEKVFENGGDVEFIEDDLLGDYGYIVLLQPD